MALLSHLARPAPTKLLRARRFLPLLCLVALAASAQPSEPVREHAVKAAFLYRFTGYVEWPPEVLEKPAFTIAVLGAPDVATELQRFLAQHRVKGRPARVQPIESPDALADAHVLYIGGDYGGDVRKIFRAIGDKPVLVVSDAPSGLDEGAIINFLVVDRRVRFEISVARAERARLKIGVELLSVAARVRGAATRNAISCAQRALLDAAAASCTQRMARL